MELRETGRKSELRRYDVRTTPEVTRPADGTRVNSGRALGRTGVTTGIGVHVMLVGILVISTGLAPSPSFARAKALRAG
jgi:hypothetical protein